VGPVEGYEIGSRWEVGSWWKAEVGEPVEMWGRWNGYEIGSRWMWGQASCMP
jgi:hypothetical protein